MWDSCPFPSRAAKLSFCFFSREPPTVPSLQLHGARDPPGHPTPWTRPGLSLPLRGLMVALSKGRLLSPLSLHSGDVASSHISLRCGCEGDPSRE